MSSIVQTIQKKSKALPISSSQGDHDDKLPGLRRRLSSLSLNLHASNISSTSAATWALHRTKSLSSMGENAGSCVKKWWDMGWAWVMSRKPSFVQDLELNEEEKHFVGYHYKGSLKHLFFKLKIEFKKLFRFDDNMSLPQTFKYNHINNSNFSNSHNDNVRRATSFGY